jgi:lysophospholipase L1-like esterase
MPPGGSHEESRLPDRPGAREAGSRARPHHVVSALLGLVLLVVLATLGVTGALPGLGSSGPAGGSAPASGPAAVPPTTGRSTHSPAPPAPLSLVALGDSVPSAETCFCTGYVEQLGQMLHQQTQREWLVHNDAQGGRTTADVEQDLSTPAVRDHLADAALVVLEVGANDFDLDRVDDRGCFPAYGSDCWASTNSDLEQGLVSIITQVRRLDHRPDVHIAILGYWNVTLDGSVGRALGQDFVLGSDSLTRLVNDTVAQAAAATGAYYVDAYAALKGSGGTQDPTAALLDDGDHPNAIGHRLLANAVLQTLDAAGAVAEWRGAL